MLRLGSADQAAFTEHSLPLAVLLAEDVASKSASLGRQPGSCDFEAFLDSLVSLLLWHRSTMLLIKRFTFKSARMKATAEIPEPVPRQSFSANPAIWRESGESIDIISS